MRHPRLLHLFLSVVFAAVPTLAAHAGQVRVDVGPLLAFTPATVALNRGDHVVWVWKGNGHTVTSGSGCAATGLLFDTVNTLSTNAGFNWKANQVGAVPYVCIPHCPGMAGTLNISASGIGVSDFRITEVRYTAAAGSNYYEISNLGPVTGNLGRYRISTQAGDVAVSVVALDLTVPSGGSVLIHPNASGTSTATDLFFPTLPEPGAQGSVALYVPNTATGHTSLSDSLQIIDYVQWGAAAQPHELTAAGHGVWTAGEFLPSVAPGHALELCGLTGQYGLAHWGEVATPTPGTPGTCATPASYATWGRLKTLYR